jgi:hypothetical protein
MRHALALVALLLGSAGNIARADGPPPVGTPRGIHFDVRLDAGAATGALPDVVPYTSLAAGFAGTRLRLELAASFWLAGRAGGADLDMWAVTARACVTPAAWRGCAGIESGSLVVDGHGGEVTYDGVSSWTAVALSVGRHVPLADPLGLLVQLGVALPIERGEIFLDGRAVHDMAPVDVRLTVGVDTTF